MGLDGRRLVEFEEYYLLPAVSGIVIGLDVVLFIHIFDFLGTVFTLTMGWNKFSTML